MDTSEIVERSLAAVKGFKDQVQRYALWNGGWIGVVAIRRGEHWISFLLRGHLTAPGVRIPPPEKVFDATTSDVIVRAREVSLHDFWPILEELPRGETTNLSALIGQQVHLHSAGNPSVWSNSSPYAWKDRAHLYASNWGSAPFHDIFGYQLFDHLGPQLRGLERPYGSLREIADAMMFFGGGGCDNNNANPRFEASAEFPIQMIESFYNRAYSGIEIRIEAGASVPLDRLSTTLTPEPRQRVAGNAFRSERDGEIRTLRALVPCAEPQTEVAVNLQFDDVPIASSRIPVETPVSTVWGDIERGGLQEWEAVLDREFHWTPRDLRRRLRAVLPSRVANVAEWRIRESILLHKEHPFFAVASAASVAEVLLKERLAKVTRKARAARWTEIRAEDPRLPRKLPGHEHLTFDQSIRLAQRLGLLGGGIDSSSVNLLRAARNQIHLERKSRLPLEDFSPVRASHALLATLDLCKRLGAVSRARPRKRHPRTV